MEAPKQIDCLVAEDVAPILKQRGFKRRRLAFSRPFPHGFDVLAFQKSSWNSATRAKFTINLGIYWSRAQELLGKAVVGVPFSEADCTVFRRIGLLTPPQKDRWWSVSQDPVPASLKEEVLQSIEHVALPWFDSGHHIDAAIVAVEEYQLTRYIEVLKSLRNELAT